MVHNLSHEHEHEHEKGSAQRIVAPDFPELDRAPSIDNLLEAAEGILAARQIIEGARELLPNQSLADQWSAKLVEVESGVLDVWNKWIEQEDASLRSTDSASTDEPR